MSTQGLPGKAWQRIAASRGAAGAVSAQVTQAAGSLALQALAAHLLGLSGLGRFALLYGSLIVITALTSGFVGDSLTVLDRSHPVVRAALQVWAGGIVGGASILAAIVTTVLGLTTPLEGLVFALAAVAYTSEDLVRRLLMAEFTFWRICVVDLVAASAAIAVVAVGASAISLTTLLAAVAIGQAAGLVVGIVLLPRGQRWLAPLSRGALGHVASFGAWRAAQQAIRPSLLTALRFTVILAAGYTAAGGIEAARIYVAPTMLVIGGVSSYLFADYSRRTGTPLAQLVRRADRSVLILAGLTVAAGLVAVVALPVAGPLLVGHTIGLIAVIGWLAYSATVAAVTPYGSLASVRGSQRWVFAARLGDSLFSLVTVLVLFALSGSAIFAPALLAVGSLAGGIVIRFAILSPSRQSRIASPTILLYPPSEGAVPRVHTS
jgi:hypothetical protein